MRLAKAVFLLSILSLNLFGFYVSFFISRIQIRTQATQSLLSTGKKSLEQFEFSVEGFNSLQRPDGDDAEVVINGAMYDIKGTEYKGGKVIVYAKRDTAETSLIASFLTRLGNDSGSDSEDSQLLIKILQQDFILNNDLPVLFQLAGMRSYPLFNVVFTSHVCDLPSPPPDTHLG